MKNFKINSRFLFYLIILICIPSCSSFAPGYKPTYTPSPFKTKEGKPIGNTLFILNIIDERSPEEKIPFEPDADPVILVPFWPYSHANLNPVIRYCYFQPNNIETTQNLFITDLRASDLFKQVTSAPFGEKAYINCLPEQIPNNAYLLQIRIKKAVWSRYLTSYGLSYPGTILWAFGAPVSFGSIKVQISAALYAPGNYKQSMGKIIISEEEPCTEWVYDQVYYKPPISEFKLAEMFPKITDKLRTFIYKTLKNIQ